eukprot:GILI01009021.1.p1 GENE.GILI01009021.1~~GILI01009021.1.p1  ORF type:complete len:298 (-),score=82.63 GILI01009021.1:138-1031(-)
MSLFGFGSGCTVSVDLANNESRKQVTVSRDGKTSERLPLFTDGEDIAGTVQVQLKPGKKLEHVGIKIELVGQIEMFYDRNNSHEFTSIVRELEAPGTLMEDKTFNFQFNRVEKPYETYSGINVRLRYFLRVTVSRHYAANITKELEFAVQNVEVEPEINNSLKMEVGIEDCLHIEFEYNKSKYHLRDVVIGKVYFLLVRIKIKHMEVAIIKRETTGSGSNSCNESETVTKFEIMDGAPVRGECIPVRLFLSGFDLTPTYKSVNNRFSVKYYLNLVLVDEEDRRYFKQQEIILWRKKL